MQYLALLQQSLDKHFSNRTSIEDVCGILENYQGKDWESFIKFNDDNYSKEPVFETKDYEVKLLCWKPEQQSSIHDHPTYGCALKVTQGTLTEELYSTYPKIKLLKTNTLGTGMVSCMQGDTTLHKVINNAKKPAISLHVYSPVGYEHKDYTIAE